MNYLRTIILFFVIVLFAAKLPAQLIAYSGGLTFSSGVDYNNGTTGNPGLFGKAYLKVNKRFQVVPSIAVFNTYKKSVLSANSNLKTFMFQADVDGVFSLFKDKSLRFMGFTGLNTTYLVSKWDVPTKIPSLIDKSDLQPGLNLGGAFQLYVNDRFDGYISAKYILGSFGQVVINVGAIYYLGGMHRRGLW